MVTPKTQSLTRSNQKLIIVAIYFQKKKTQEIFHGIYKVKVWCERRFFRIRESNPGLSGNIDESGVC
ncbi:hypothetical protein GcC1_179031 [Golovinomyces cichoracearum]|uniref:Uncharacterized protein n=1 Tax=Golovinomyces cichoracearum TaxID=62708 RepID=A0A420HNI0_9PEZI|nr:hypothetical protein GcC1_179031 [Golovinomyces cichoracearum]